MVDPPQNEIDTKMERKIEENAFSLNSSKIQKNNRICAITMKQIADYHFGEFGYPKGYSLPKKITSKSAKKIKFRSFLVLGKMYNF